MKTLQTLFSALACVFAAGMFTACSDDPVAPTPGRIENNGEERVTILHLSSRDIAALAGTHNVEFLLENPEKRVSFTFRGSIQTDRNIRLSDASEAIVCRLAIGNADIPDGNYYLTVRGDGIPDIRLRRVAFKGNLGNELDAQPISYDDLSGKGTREDPYLINDDGDFLTLLWYLEDDPDHAYGKYFRQTASFDVPPRSMIVDGHIWAPVTFSGNYDGGGNELRSLIYQGSSDPAADKNIGLFKDLYSATVTNLAFKNAMIVNAGENVGILAGSCDGNNHFENITLSGSITAAGNNIGALVGKSTGSLSLKNIRVSSMLVAGSENTSYCVGMLVGRHDGSDFSADNVSTPDHIFSVTGAENVGGIIGALSADNSISLSHITIEHSVDAESSDTKVIYGKSRYIGGLIGFTEKNNKIALSSVSVKAPVRGGGDVGALAGHAYVADMTVSSTTLSSVVSGENSVGGFFGYLGFHDAGGKMTFDCSSSPIRYIVKSSSAASVSGKKYVGGLVGYFDSNHGRMDFLGRVEIAVNVKGSENVGGAIGFGNKLDSFNPEGLNFSSSTMRVEASVNYAGGVVGYMNSGSVTGSLGIKPVEKLPAGSDLTSCFSGVVNSPGTVGGVVAYAAGTVSGVASDATVTSNGVDAGGIVGSFVGTVSSCAFNGSVSAAQSAGGIFGISIGGDVYVSDCVNFGQVTTNQHSGGIGGYTRIGDLNNFFITRCYNSGKISGPAAAGIICYADCEHSGCRNKYFDITYCGNNGQIEGTGGDDNSVGGIAATVYNYSPYMQSCANHGPVSGGKQYAIGGVVGDFGRRSGDNFGKVTRCMNSAKVSASSSSTHVGGVVGHLHSGDLSYDSEITDCYNTGELPTDQNSDTGGILGYAANYTNIYRTFNRGKVSHGNAIIGTHHSGSLFHHKNNYYLSGTGGGWPSSTEVSANKIADKSVYHDFDFTNIWDISSQGPVLRDCPFL